MLLNNLQVDYLVFEVNNDTITPIGSCNTLTSATWTVNFIGEGEFEFWVPVNDENLLLFKKDNMIYKGDGVAGIINSITKEKSEDEIKLHVKGKTLEVLLEYRIIFDTMVFTNKSYKQIAEELVDTNCVNPINKNRIIPFFKIESTPASIENGVDEDKLQDLQKTGGSVYDFLDEIMTEANLGFEVYFNLEDFNFVFRVNNWTDRTVNQSEIPAVIFSTDLEDVISSEYYMSTDDYKNFAKIDGEEKENEPRKFELINDDLIGLNRRELYVDARDIQSEVQNEAGEEPTIIPDAEYRRMLIQRGNEKLSEHVIYETFEAEIDLYRQVTFAYGVDYFLGDKVTVIDEDLGLQVDAQILSIEETIDKEYKMYITFGFSTPTINQKLKSIKRSIK